MTKTMNIITITGFLTLALAALAFAGPGHGRGWGGFGGGCPGWGQGPGHGMGYGAGYRAMTPEQGQKLDKVYAEHYEEVEPLRRELYAKRLELRALSGNANADPDRVRELAREVTELRGKLLDARRDLAAGIEDSGVPAYGYGGGGMGPGYHMGPAGRW
jgi:zinc resistance-associated protein